MKYHVGDLVHAGDAIVRITRVDEDLAWFVGQPLDRPHAFTVGWMRQSANHPVLRRKGQSVSQEGEEIYQQALRQFPGSPWDKASPRIDSKAIAILEARAIQALERESPPSPSDHAAG